MRNAFMKTLLLVVAIPLGAVGAQEKVVVTAENAKMLVQPSLSGVGTVLVKGATLTVLERKGDWVTVYDGRKQGFVHSAFLTSTVSAPAVVDAAPAPPTQQGLPVPTYGVQRQQMGYAPAAQPMRLPGMPGFKDPNTSRLFSIVFIGGGQFYSGETKKGLLLAGLGYGSWVALPMFALSRVNSCTTDFNNGNFADVDDCGASSIGAVALASYAVSLGTWIYGIVDADNAALRTNLKPAMGWQPAFRTDGKRTYLGVQHRVR